MCVTYICPSLSAGLKQHLSAVTTSVTCDSRADGFYGVTVGSSTRIRQKTLNISISQENKHFLVCIMTVKQ